MSYDYAIENKINYIFYAVSILVLELMMIGYILLLTFINNETYKTNNIIEIIVRLSLLLSISRD